MANRPHVPKFGDWKEDAPFTVVFEKASSSKKSMKVSNNTNEYPEMLQNPTQTRNHRQESQPPNHNARSRHERFSSREEIEFRPSPAHNERNNSVRPPPTPENHQSYGGGGRSGPPRDHVPPVRPIRNLRGQSSERVATIPPFPGSGSNMENQSYTHIFDKVKDDRRSCYGTGAPSQPLNSRQHQPLPPSTKWYRVKTYDGTDRSTRTGPINNHQALPSSPTGCWFLPWRRRVRYYGR